MMMSKALLTVERYFSHNITTQKRNYTIYDLLLFPSLDIVKTMLNLVQHWRSGTKIKWNKITQIIVGVWYFPFRS